MPVTEFELQHLSQQQFNNRIAKHKQTFFCISNVYNFVVGQAPVSDLI